MVAYAKPQQRKKEESERLRGERYQIKYYKHVMIAFGDAKTFLLFSEASQED